MMHVLVGVMRQVLALHGMPSLLPLALSWIVGAALGIHLGVPFWREPVLGLAAGLALASWWLGGRLRGQPQRQA
ncbi:MAG: hypothetical protein ACPGUV_04315, partial [Polyangiales bacterium]